MPELHYAGYGSPSNPPVLFLHGFMGSAGDWEPIVAALEEQFYCLCVDLPGHGRSTRFPRLDTYTMPATSSLLLNLFTKEGIENAHIVGYSMGGRTALYFAAHHAARCRKLVLESASPGLEKERDRLERRGVDQARAERLETEDFLEFLEEWYDQPLFDTYRDRPELLRRMISTRSNNDPRELARSLRGMGTGQQPALWDRLATLHVPVLAVAGALDGKYVETAERMRVLMPNVRTAIIPDAGHNVHAEQPDVYADTLSDFLTKPS